MPFDVLISFNLESGVWVTSFSLPGGGPCHQIGFNDEPSEGDVIPGTISYGFRGAQLLVPAVTTVVGPE